MKCRRCEVEYEGSVCMNCERTRESLLCCIDICRENECNAYYTDGPKEKCKKIARPCDLVKKLAAGWRCELGLHDEI